MPSTCARTTRNGPCRGRSLQFGIGPAMLTLCRRHRRLYDAEHERQLARVLSQHQQGLHGEGDDRKAFAERHVSGDGEHYLTCRSCYEEMQADELGVRPDHVAEAMRINRSMERDLTEAAQSVQTFKAKLEEDVFWAIRAYADRVVKYQYLAACWKDVRDTIGRDRRNDQGEVDGQYDIVDAYQQVVKQVSDRLIKNQLKDKNDREAAASFIRGW